jgi:hypothetical protein
MLYTALTRRLRGTFHVKGIIICPKCGRELEMALPPNGGKGHRFNQCFNRDRPDPIKSGNTQAWLKGELAPND